MSLKQLQKTFMALITQPLTSADGMRPRTADGRSNKALSESMVKPSPRQTSFQRLELYNTGYWFRILQTLAGDFPGLRAVIGRRRFDTLSAAYLHDCPPLFDLRDLGSRLETWLRKHPEFTPGRERLALDMVRLEWAEIEAAESAMLPSLAEDDPGRLGEDTKMRLQPHVRLLDLSYPVDDVLLKARGLVKEHSDIASNAVAGRMARDGKRCPMPARRDVFLAVHRHDEIVYFKRLEPEAFRLLCALQQGRRLSKAIDRAFYGSEKDMEELAARLKGWFAEWSLLGWFCAAGGLSRT